MDPHLGHLEPSDAPEELRCRLAPTQAPTPYFCPRAKTPGDRPARWTPRARAALGERRSMRVAIASNAAAALPCYDRAVNEMFARSCV